jgi:undecaprenyl diphosphate synthase
MTKRAREPGSLADRPARMRVPRHVGLIPDGNRRWADEHGLPRHEGYAAGIGPGIRLVRHCRELGVEELSVYGFTMENTHRPAPQVEAFRSACVEFSELVLQAGAALLVIGECHSRMFPEALRPFAERRSPGEFRVNMLVNYGWQWDLRAGLAGARAEAANGADPLPRMGSHGASRIDLVVRWGGRRRLSGFLPLQSAYADLHVIDTLWPDMQPEEFDEALGWYARQEQTLGG